ncbi:MAG: AsnC family transcriptional regulator, partial [Rubrivivax sp.]
MNPARMERMEPASRIDAIDQRILQALQANGRATYDELAQAVGLSA